METTLDLLEYAEMQSGEQMLSGTSPYRARFLKSLNRAYKAIYGGGAELNEKQGRIHIFNFALEENPYRLEIKPGLFLECEIFSGDDEIILSDTYTPSLLGYYFRLPGETMVHRITAHTAGTDTVTLDVPVTKNGTYTAEFMPLDYVIPTVAVIVDELRAYRNSDEGSDCDKVSIVSLEAIDNLSYVRMGDPDKAGIVKHIAGGDLKLRMNRYSENGEYLDFRRVVYPTTALSTSDNPILPPEFCVLLAEFALYYFMLGRDDTRAGEHLSIARAQYKALVRADRSSSEIANPNFGKVIRNV